MKRGQGGVGWKLSGKELEALIKQAEYNLEYPYPYPKDHFERKKAEEQIRKWKERLK